MKPCCDSSTVGDTLFHLLERIDASADRTRGFWSAEYDATVTTAPGGDASALRLSTLRSLREMTERHAIAIRPLFVRMAFTQRLLVTCDDDDEVTRLSPHYAGAPLLRVGGRVFATPGALQRA